MTNRGKIIPSCYRLQQRLLFLVVTNYFRLTSRTNRYFQLCFYCNSVAVDCLNTEFYFDTLSQVSLHSVYVTVVYLSVTKITHLCFFFIRFGPLNNAKPSRYTDKIYDAHSVSTLLHQKYKRDEIRQVLLEAFLRRVRHVYKDKVLFSPPINTPRTVTRRLSDKRFACLILSSLQFWFSFRNKIHMYVSCDRSKEKRRLPMVPQRKSFGIVFTQVYRKHCSRSR